MGVLKTLTDEYFGDRIRGEDLIIKTILDNNKNNRDYVVRLLKKKGWGENSNDFLIFNDETHINNVIFLNEEEAKEFLFDEKNKKYDVISLKTYLTTEDTYFKEYLNIFNSPKVEDIFKKMCKLYYDYPQVVTYYLLLYFNDYIGIKYDENLIPFEFNTYPSDEAFENGDGFEEGDNLLIFSTTDGIFIQENEWYEPFTLSFNKYINEFDLELEKLGFKLTNEYFGSYPYPTNNWCYFYK